MGKRRLWMGIGMVLALLIGVGWGPEGIEAAPRPQEALAGMFAADGQDISGMPAWLRAGVAVLRDNPKAMVQPTFTRGIIAEAVVNLRRGPGLNYGIMGELRKGTTVTVLKTEKDWLQVRLSNGQTGWVAQWLVKSAEPPTPSRSGGEISSGNTQIPIETGPGQIDLNQKPSGSTANTQVIIAEEVVNLRGGPGTDYPVVAQVSRGQALDYIDQDQGWYRVTMPRGGEGWVAGWLVFVNGPPVSLDPKKPFQGWSITLDPGHGNYNPQFDVVDQGARGRGGTLEKDVVLAIARRLGQILSDKGATVYYTRTQDCTIENSGVTTSADLKQRADLANGIPTNLFISIHANAAENSSLDGTSTYFYAPADSALESQRGLRQKLASAVQAALVESIDRPNRGVREANYAVLRETLMPSILVETAYITNPAEERLLADAGFQMKVAQGIAQGIEDYIRMAK